MRLKDESFFFFLSEIILNISALKSVTYNTFVSGEQRGRREQLISEDFEEQFAWPIGENVMIIFAEECAE